MLRCLPILLVLGGCLHAPVRRIPANNAHVVAGGVVGVELEASAELTGPKVHADGTVVVEGDADAVATRDVFVALPDVEASADAAIASAFAATDDALAAVDGLLATAHVPSVDVNVSIDGSVSVGEGWAAGAHGSDGSSAVDGSAGSDAWVDGAGSGSIDGTGSVDGNGAVDSNGSVEGNGSLRVDAELDVLGEAEQPERLAERDRGVRATGRVRVSLGGLMTDGGLEVDGMRTRLDDLAPLAETETEAAGATTLQVGGNVRVSGDLEVDPNDPNEGRVVVRVRGDEPAQVRARARVRVHLVVDRSSSMHRNWPDVQAAARTLVERLDPRDEIHVVAYDANAEEVVPLGPVGDGRAVLRALTQISVGGGTNIEAGLGAAYRAAYAAPTAMPSRVILLSDGVPNGGAFTAAELAPMAARASAAGCLTSTIGIGDSFDADVLRSVARAGSGGYHVALEPHTLAPNLAAELERARVEAAASVNVRLDLGDGVQLAEGVDASALTPEVRGLAAGEERRFVIRVRLRSNQSYRGARVRIRVRLGAGGQVHRAEGTVRGRSGIATVRVAADADLANAMDLAAEHLNNGRAEQASAALVAHANRYTPYEADARLRVRVGAVRRVAEAVRVLTPRTSHASRRRVALAMGEMASRLLR